MAERLGHPVRPIIVVARNVVDAIVTTMLQLAGVGGLSSASRPRCRAPIRRACSARRGSAPTSPTPRTVRLVIAHRSGRTDTYHIGAHPPSLTPVDLDLIHRVWLDAVKAVGPHVHHHDVVRAALTQMEQQLTGPARDEALAAIRDVARPADELAAVLQATRLRPPARHAAQPARGRRRRAAHRSQHRGSGRRVPRAAAQGRRGGVRVPVAGRHGRPAQGDGAGGRRGAAQQHGAGRPHPVPRRAAGRRHAAAAVAAHAGRALGRRSRCSAIRSARSGA